MFITWGSTTITSISTPLFFLSKNYNLLVSRVTRKPFRRLNLFHVSDDGSVYLYPKTDSEITFNSYTQTFCPRERRAEESK